MLRIPRFMLCGVSSGSGKTWIAGGLLCALKKRGIRAEAFKCGPDYIDPLFHSEILGLPCRNLDTYLTDENTVRFLFQRGCMGRDLSVVEGVMGYYDGLGAASECGSSYELASMLEIPVILILPCRGIGNSAAAVAKGFLTYRNPSYIKGFILNQVSEAVYPRLKEKIEQETGARVFGYVPWRKDLSLKSRHLGLLMPGEDQRFREKFEELAMLLERTVDIGGLLNAAGEAPQMEAASDPLKRLAPPDFSSNRLSDARVGGCPLCIGIARDEAFCFLYEDNLDFLQRLGAELVFFSPLHEPSLPEGLDGIIFPGGYPENYAGQLAANRSMLCSVREMAGRIPILAECGGFLYLHESLVDKEGRSFPMVGLIKGKAYPAGKLKRFGYVELEAQNGQLLLQKGGRIRAHEFHYWESSNCGESCIARKAYGSSFWKCVHGNPFLYAGFPHIYFYANPEAGLRFVEKCRKSGI